MALRKYLLRFYRHFSRPIRLDEPETRSQKRKFIESYKHEIISVECLNWDKDFVE